MIHLFHFASVNQSYRTYKINNRESEAINTGDNNSTKENAVFSPLRIACQRGQCDSAQILIERGANINAFDKDGSNPLTIACEQGHDNIVQLLLNNADINLCRNNGTIFVCIVYLFICFKTNVFCNKKMKLN